MKHKSNYMFQGFDILVRIPWENRSTKHPIFQAFLAGTLGCLSSVLFSQQEKDFNPRQLSKLTVNVILTKHNHDLGMSHLFLQVGSPQSQAAEFAFLAFLEGLS